MNSATKLRAVPLFAWLADADIDRVAAHSTTVHLSPGEELFAEGDVGDQAYVICSGEIEITKMTGGREVLLTVRHDNEVIGEMALLQAQPRNATARAKTDAELIAIPRSEIDALLDGSAGAVKALFGVLLERWMATEAHLRQSARMVQLGTLTAGLAHELNNPAAASNRAATQLRTAVEALAESERLLASGVDAEEAERLHHAREGLVAGTRPASGLDALTRADLEDRLGAIMAEAGIEDAWRLAPDLVDAVEPDALEGVIAAAGSRAPQVVASAHAHRVVRGLLHEVEEGTRRTSAIVRALRSYSFLDQAPVQEIDLVSGIEDTLLILKPKLSAIEIRLDIATDLPRIEAYGSELNQVWTNLIENAADAIAEADRADGVITVRAAPSDDEVIVEVEDNGVGIPAEARDRIFDAFFTTKAPGSGTGLGLNITYNLVVRRHRGNIEFDSQPGRTVFRVTLHRQIDS